MTARVRFYGVIRGLVGESAVTVEVPRGFTLGSLVDALAARCGEPVRSGLVSSWGYLQGHVRVFVDGRDVGGSLSEPVGSGTGDDPCVDVYVVPMTEGGGE